MTTAAFPVSLLPLVGPLLREDELAGLGFVDQALLAEALAGTHDEHEVLGRGAIR